MGGVFSCNCLSGLERKVCRVVSGQKGGMGMGWGRATPQSTLSERPLSSQAT